jgi:hypothetical protein
VALKDLVSGKEVVVGAGYQGTVGPGMEEPALEVIQHEEETPEKNTEEARKEKGADETGSQKDTGKGSEKSYVGFGIDGSFGADVLTDPDDPSSQKIYYSLSLMPEVSVWKFGMGIDLNIYFDEEGNLRDEEWDDLGDIVGKIWYVRYGQKNDPLFALVGGIKGYSLGHGFILNNYTNMLNYPSIRKKGLILEVDFGRFGLNSIVSDIEEYPVIGGRLFFRPLYSAGIPIFKNLAIGVCGAMDKNPDKYDGTEDDGVLFYGADAELPILNILPVTASIYFDYAVNDLGSSYDFLEDGGTGNTIGIGGSVLSKVKYAFEYRKMDNNFISGYFDTYYEVNREFKPLGIGVSKDPKREGPVFMLGFDLLNKLSVSVNYQDYNIDALNKYPYFHGNLNVDPSLLMDKITLSVSYDNQNVNSLKDLTELDGAIMTTEVGYKVAKSVTLFVIQKQTFDESGGSTKSTSMRTQFSF